MAGDGRRGVLRREDFGTHSEHVKAWRQTASGKAAVKKQTTRATARMRALRILADRHRQEFVELFAAELRKVGLEL